MAQGIQSSIIGDRLRRAFGLRGLISTAVDEIVVPTARAFDLDSPPFRTEGLAWFISNRHITAGTFGHVGVYASDSVRCLVEKVVITNLDAAAQDFRIAMNVQSPAGAQSVVPETIGGPAVPLGPVVVYGQNLVSAAGPPIVRVRLQPGENFTWDAQVGLTPDPALPGFSRSLVVACDTAAVIVQASFAGRFWPGAFG